MIGKLWSIIRRANRPTSQPAVRLSVVMAKRCRDQIAKELLGSTSRGHEGMVYFVGLTNGTTTLALFVVAPEATTTPGSVDVSAREIGKIIRAAAEAGLQVVGQLHTHPKDAYHSPGDFTGMNIRHPGYFSIVLPEYGTHLPSLEQTHAVMWTSEGFKEIDHKIKILDGFGT